MLRHLLLISFLFSLKLIGAQNLNFETGSTTDWTITGNSGVTNSSNPNNIPVTQIVSSGNDPYGGFPVSFPGGNYSLKLGSSNCYDWFDNGMYQYDYEYWNKAEITVTVDVNNPILRINYANVVLQYGHSQDDAAFISFNITPIGGSATIPCLNYIERDGGGFGGISTTGMSCEGEQHTVKCNPWKSRYFDLSPYTGSSVKITLYQTNCRYAVDWSYAYFDLDFFSSQLTQTGSLCTGDVVLNGPVIEGVNYNWSGPGISSSTSTNTITVNQAGTYTLQITSPDGCLNFSKTITVQGASFPSINFTSTIPNCAKIASFTNTSTDMFPNDTSFVWDFGDGATSSVFNPTHTYTVPGTYTVSLLSLNGCLTPSVTIPVEVYEAPTPILNVLNNCLNEAVLYSVIVTYPAGQNFVAGSWTLDTSAQVTGLLTDNPISLSYTSAGTKTSSYLLQTNHCTVIVDTSVIVFPTPLAAYSVAPVCDGFLSIFQDASSVTAIAGDTITNWNWSFGDGSTSTTQNPQHLYTDENSYASSLIVTTNYGCKDTISIPVIVWPLPQVAFSATEVCEGYLTDFTDLSTISNSNTSNQNVGWNWTFGDLGNSTVQHPAHLYLSDGTFTAQLIVTSNQGCVDSLVKQVVVDPKPVADFNGLNLNGCSPLSLAIGSAAFVDAPGIITDEVWTFNNGVTSTGDSLFSYLENLSDQTEYYDLQLIVTTNQGCIDTLSQSQYIAVYHNPIAMFDYSPENPDLLNTTVEFDNTSLYATTYSWQFGTFQNSTLFEPEIAFPFDPTNYEIVLAVATNEGCVDTARTVLEIADILIYYVPNTFTPDGDAHNNVFLPVFTSGFDPYNYNLQIYNRWGEVVFESKDHQVGWDGNYQDQAVQEGTYTWKIDFKASDSNKRYSENGHVNVLR